MSDGVYKRIPKFKLYYRNENGNINIYRLGNGRVELIHWQYNKKRKIVYIQCEETNFFAKTYNYILQLIK